jgi:hypothetical protein
MNTPGPFYTSEADFAFLGPTNAPGMVSVDLEQVDVVYRQPVTLREMELLISVASCDPLGGYGVDGNQYWSIDLVRAWWERRAEIVEHIKRNVSQESWYRLDGLFALMQPIARCWLRYIETECYSYLREYMFFLDHGRWPNEETRLPDVS